jgi:hypothetical protein
MGYDILCWKRIQAFLEGNPSAVSRTAALLSFERQADSADETRNDDDVWRRRSEPFLYG